jgi:DNA-binding transcriptional regulator YiaG
MTAEQFRQTLRELGMTQSILVRHLGVNKSTVNRWAKDQLAVPQYAIAYLGAVKKLHGADISC